MDNAAERALELAGELTAACDAFAEQLDALVPVADELVSLEGRYRAACTQAGAAVLAP